MLNAQTFQTSVRDALLTWTNNPINDDSWSTSIEIPSDVITDEEIIAFVNASDRFSEGYAIWVYDGPNYKSASMELLFFPFEKDRPIRRIKDACLIIKHDETCEMERMERASEAFAAGGMDEYNYAMGYGVIS